MHNMETVFFITIFVKMALEELCIIANSGRSRARLVQLLPHLVARRMGFCSNFPVSQGTAMTFWLSRDFHCLSLTS